MYFTDFPPLGQVHPAGLYVDDDYALKTHKRASVLSHFLFGSMFPFKDIFCSKCRMTVRTSRTYGKRCPPSLLGKYAGTQVRLFHLKQFPECRHQM